VTTWTTTGAPGSPAWRAAAAREALGNPSGYLADAALVFRAWDFRVEDVRCPVSLWYGALDAHAPPRNGHWLADRLRDADLHLLPGTGHLGSLLRTWGPILDDVARGPAWGTADPA
jgi:pimeloyl-ACP methyl ester carboxylesterase